MAVAVSVVGVNEACAAGGVALYSSCGGRRDAQAAAASLHNWKRLRNRQDVWRGKCAETSVSSIENPIETMTRPGRIIGFLTLTDTSIRMQLFS